MLTLEAIVGIVTALALLASGAALFVSMKVSSSLNSFKNDFLAELDERYVRVKDHNHYESMRAELEQNYRTTTKGQLEGLVVEIHRDKNDLNIALKGILAAIMASGENVARKGGRG